MYATQTPRPIGFISSVNPDGVTNLAPFSYFTMANHDPPVVVVSFTHPPPKDGQSSLKETCQNILDTKQFVANLISESFVEAANYTSVDAPKDVSEWALSGLTPVPSKLVKAPRVGESAFAMECDLGGCQILGCLKSEPCAGGWELTRARCCRALLSHAQRRGRPDGHDRARAGQVVPRQGGRDRRLAPRKHRQASARQ